MAANRVMNSVTKWLEKHLRVKVNATKTKVARPDQCKYLGYTFFWKNGKWCPKPHIKSIQKLKNNLKPLLKRNWGVSLEYRIKRINQVTRGWLNYFRFGQNIKRKLEKIDQNIRFHLRMCIWKQWKTTRARANHLYFLRVPRWRCWSFANTRKGYARVARALNSAITTGILEGKGLISLAKYHGTTHVLQLQMSIC